MSRIVLSRLLHRFNLRKSSARRRPRRLGQQAADVLEARQLLSAMLWVDAASTKSGDFHTIQAAVNAANNGDTIKVAPGVYTESVTVSKSVTISGGLPRLAGESGPSIIHSDATALTLSASNTTIKGFTITTASAAGNGVAVGISTDGTQSGDTIQNNIIQGEFVGVALNSPTTGTVLASAVSNNQFQNNGTAIASTLGLENAKINGNTFTGDTTWSVSVNGTGASNVQIVNNQFTSEAAILLVNVDSSKVGNNTIVNPIADAIDLEGGVTNSDFTNNTISVTPGNFYANGILARSDLSDAVDSGNRFANNSISGGQAGFWLVATTGNTISGNTVTGNNVGIELLSSDASFNNNTASSNVNEGILVFGDAAITATDNTTNNNGGLGIEIFSPNDITMTGNTSTNNGGSFEARSNLGNVTFNGNQADNSGVGPRLAGGTVIVRNNQIIGNTLSGLTAFGDTLIVTGNTANDNGQMGIDVDGPTVTVTGNTANGNTEDGFFIGATTGKISNNTADSNIGTTGFEISAGAVSVTGNTSTNNAGDGFRFENLDGTTVANNTATGNTQFGISVSFGTSCTLSRNTASNNASNGFEIMSDTVTLNGNTADSNEQDGFFLLVNQGTVINNSADFNQGVLDPNGSIDGGFVFARGTLIVRGNSSTNNAEDGFLFEGAGGTIANNIATGNGADGFAVYSVGTNYFGPGSTTLNRNTAENNGNDGLLLQNSEGNVLKNNTALLNGAFDLSDDSTGTGTAGTANTWTNNTANTSNPTGLN